MNPRTKHRLQWFVISIIGTLGLIWVLWILHSQFGLSQYWLDRAGPWLMLVGIAQAIFSLTGRWDPDISLNDEVLVMDGHHKNRVGIISEVEERERGKFYLVEFPEETAWLPEKWLFKA